MQKSNGDMLKELYTVILGVPATGEKGMAQLVYDIERHLRELNGQVKTNTAWRKSLCWVMAIMIPLVATMLGLLVTKF